MTADIQDQQGGFDPWWKVKTGGANVEQSILWKCDVGKIFQSTDGGTSWNDVTPVEDPPNTWGDVTAPTVAGLTFLQRVDNIHVGNQHIFLCQQTGANRAWLLKTSDDGVTWSWTPMTVSDYDGSYFYPVGAKMVCTGGAPGYYIPHDVGSIPGMNDGLTGYWQKEASGCSNGYTSVHAFFDFGVAIGGTVTFEFRTRGDMTAAGQDIRYSITAASYDDVTDDDAGPGPWSNASGDSETWYAADASLTWHSTGSFTLPGATSNTARYIRLRMGNTAGDAQGTVLHIDAVRSTGTATIPDTIPIWMDVDTQDGSILWITYWADDELWLQKRSTDSLSVLNTISLGAATEAEVGAKTYIAYPFTPAFDNTVVFVYGRLQNPQSLGDPSHLIKTADTGDTWSLVSGSLGSDYIGALQAWANNNDWEIVFVRNVVAGSAGEFWRGINTPVYKSDTTFQVNQDAMTVYNNNIAIAAIAAVGGQAINVSTDGGATWADITGTHPAGSSGEVKSLVYV